MFVLITLNQIEIKNILATSCLLNNSVDLQLYIWHSFLLVEVVSEGETSGHSEYMKQVLWLLSKVYQLQSSLSLQTMSHADSVIPSCTSTGSELHCPLIRHSFTAKERCVSPKRSKKCLNPIIFVPCCIRYNYKMKINAKINARCHLFELFTLIFFIDIYKPKGTACTVHIS